MLSRIVAILNKNSLIIAYRDTQGLQYMRINDDRRGDGKKPDGSYPTQAFINYSFFSNRFLRADCIFINGIFFLRDFFKPFFKKWRVFLIVFSLHVFFLLF